MGGKFSRSASSVIANRDGGKPKAEIATDKCINLMIEHSQQITDDNQKPHQGKSRSWKQSSGGHFDSFPEPGADILIVSQKWKRLVQVEYVVCQPIEKQAGLIKCCPSRNIKYQDMLSAVLSKNDGA